MQRKNDHIHDDLARELLASVLLALLSMATYMFLTTSMKADPVSTGIIIIVVYTVLIVGIFLAVRLARPQLAAAEDLRPVLGSIMLDVVLKLNSPVLICDDGGRIIWYNKVLGPLSDRTSVYGTTLQSIFHTTLDHIMQNPSGVDVTTAAGDRHYNAVGYKVKTSDKSYSLIVFTDTTELHAMARELEEENTIVSYILVDNLEEMLQYEQEKYRAAANEIEKLLRAWASESGGVIKEYERDKYIFLFSAQHLRRFVSEKFDILDKVRDIRVGDSNLSVTISMGVSGTAGTLTEKEKSAQSCLDLALQRGGDQVVLKTETSTDFYGGRTKAVQKRTKVRARVMSNELVAHISGADNVLVMAHRFPDFDAFGACIAMARLAMFCGVKVHIVADRQDANLAGCFAALASIPEYGDLFIDAQMAMDMVQKETLLVLVDVNNPDHAQSRELFDHLKKRVVIDHHRKTAEYETAPLITYIDPSASSTCELMTEILEQVLPPDMLDQHEATLMLSGIILDTKQFSKNTGTRTFGAAQYLRDRGASPTEAEQLFRTGLDDYMREARFGSNVVIYREIAAISLNNEPGEAPDRIAAAKAADKLLTVEGVEASFALVQIGTAIHISARSTGNVNVQLILEELRGGGHYDAAGAQVEGATMAETLVRLKAAIDGYIDKVK